VRDRQRIGVIGGGLIAQVEHIPNLLALREQFELVGLSDPSASVRDGLSARFGLAVMPEAAQLLDRPLDAVLIAAPDPWHASMARDAMERGLHVFCEKPLCYGLAELDELATLQQRSGTVLQVGYMKRFDPSYQAALDLVSGKGDRLRLVTVEVNDPDAWPFVAHHPLVPARDNMEELAAETARLRRSQVEAALGFVPDDTIFRGFVGVYCSALVHDVNAVHGLLDACGVAAGPVLGASIFAGGSGGHAAVDLRQHAALWTCTYAEVPKLADYQERISFYFEDEVVELTFPAPYLNHHPTRLLHKRSSGNHLSATVIRPGYDEAFISELSCFWNTVTRGGAARNTVADARQDQALLIEMARKARSSMPSTNSAS
jgi:hypothetical protein